MREATKKEGKKSGRPKAPQLPTPAKETFKTNESLEVVYLSKDGKAWYWTERHALKYFGEGQYHKIKRPK